MQAKILLSVLLIAFCTLKVSICLGNDYNAYILNKKKDYFLGDTIYVISQIPIQKSMQVDFLNPELLKNFDLLGEKSDTVRIQDNLFIESKIELRFKKVGRQFLPVKVNKNDTANFDKNRMNDSLTVICNQITQSHKFDNLFSSSRRLSPQKLSNINSGDKDIVFIKIEPQKTKVKVGEEIIVEYYAYSLNSFNIQESALNGVQFAYSWEDKDYLQDKLNIQSVSVHGVKYEKQLIKRIHIFPQNSGVLEIGGGQVSGIANVVSGEHSVDAQLANLTGQQLMDTAYTQVVCPKISILVDSILGPKEFITGDYILSRFPVDSTIIGQNSSIEFKLKLEGYGNLKYKSIPELESNQDWDVLPGAQTDSFYVRNGKVYGYRIWSYTIFPKRFGKLLLPMVEISCLSTRSGKIELLKSEQGVVTFIDKDAAVKIADQKREMKEQRALKKRIILVSSLIGISLILLYGVFWYRKRYIIPKQIARIKELEDKQPYRTFIQEIEEIDAKRFNSNEEMEKDLCKVFSQYFSNRFNTKEIELNELLIRKVLQEKHIDENNIQNLLVIQEKLLENDFGIGFSNEQKQNLRKELKQCITTIEQNLDSIQHNTFV